MYHTILREDRSFYKKFSEYEESCEEKSQPSLKVGNFELASRLVVGTGKYASYAEMAECLDASGTDCVTVAVRRERLLNTAGENILDHLDLERYTLLPNTAGCFSADDAVRVARLGRELLRDLGNKGSEWVWTLLEPDVRQTE